MKHLMFIILNSDDIAEKAMEKLTEAGFNGTVIPSSSLRHVLSEEKEEDIPFFVNLNHLEKIHYKSSKTFFALIDEEKIEAVKTIIRDCTDDFKKCKGAMFTIPVDSFEGSF